MIVYFSVLVAIIGALAFALSANPKIAEPGVGICFRPGPGSPSRSSLSRLSCSCTGIRDRASSYISQDITYSLQVQAVANFLLNSHSLDFPNPLRVPITPEVCSRLRHAVAKNCSAMYWE
jgi:hypothetical protein